MLGEVSSFWLRNIIGESFQNFRNIPLFDIISVIKKLRNILQISVVYDIMLVL